MYNIVTEMRNFQQEFEKMKKLVSENVQIDGETLEKDKIEYIINYMNDYIAKMNSLIESLNK